jgi:hypothetical protein
MSDHCANLSSKYPTWRDLGLNAGVSDWKPATNRLRYCLRRETALRLLFHGVCSASYRTTDLKVTVSTQPHA